MTKGARINKLFHCLAIACISIALFICSSLPYLQAGAAVYAEDADNNEVTFYDDSKLNGITEIEFPFLDTAEAAFDWAFPYTDDFFRHSSSEMSIKHAQASLGMAACAFRSTTGVVDPQYETYLKGAGFTNLYAFGYDKETTQDSLSGIIGMKVIDDFTVIAAVTCGQGYQNEWAGNFIIGSGVRHEGFENAAGLLESYIAEYIDQNEITGSKKLWLSGLSRAAAVSNIAAADAIESGDYDDVYAYLYGVPRTTREPEAMKGIYNISGQYDPVAAIPFESWGFGRYGTDFYTPAQESDEGYFGLSEKASEVSERVTGKGFRNNPEINYQLRLVLEFLGAFFPTSDDYVDKFQENIISAMKDKDPNTFLVILADAISATPAYTTAEEESKAVFVDYISYMAGEHIKANQRQINEGNWAEDESLAANAVLEHRPSTYINWMFADADPEDLLMSPLATRKITFIGTVAIDVYHDGELVGQIGQNGKTETFARAGSNGKTIIPNIFMMRNGSQTVINLPADEEYNLEIKAIASTNLTYYDMTLSADRLMESQGYMYAGRMMRGNCSLDVVPGERLRELTDEDSKFAMVSHEDYNFSPTVIMRNEIGATSNSSLTIGRMMGLVFGLISGLNTLIFVCLIIAFVHRRKRKKGHPPYSKWWVILPHLLCIATFVYLTQYITYHMFAIGQARSICATVANLFVFLLALRGLITNRNRKNLIFTFVMLALVPLTYFFYNNLPIDSFSYVNIAVYVLIMTAFTVIAVRSFTDRQAADTGSAEQSDT